MSNTILIKRSGTANAVPSAGNISLGELAINYTDGNLFYKDNLGAVQTIASRQFVSVSGNITGANLNAAGLSLSGNVLSALNSTSNVTTTGNVSANYFLGNGRFLTGIDTTLISNGNATVQTLLNGNITVNPAGVSNVAVFSPNGVEISGVVSATGNITGNYFFGNGSQLTGVNAASTNANNLTGNTLSSNVIYSSLTTVGTLTSLSVTGNTNTGNLNTANLSLSGNVVSDINSTSNITTTSNIAGGNLLAGSGIISTSGNITGGNLNAAGLSLSSNVVSALNSTSNITTTANVAAGNLLTDGLYHANGTPWDFQQPAGANTQIQFNDGAGGFGASANLTFDSASNLLTVGGDASVTGNISAATVSASGNITAANFTTSGNSGNITGANVISATTLSASANVIGGNITTVGQVSASGNVTGNYFIGNGSQLTGVAASSVDANNLIGNTLSSNVLYSSLTSVGTLSSLSVSGNITGDSTINGNTVSATANVIGGNITTAGVISATGNLTAGNLNAAGLSLSSNVVSALNSTSNITTSANIFGGNLLTSGAISTSGNLAANNLSATNSVSANIVSATGNITGGNIATGGLISATGNLISGNINTGILSLSGNVISDINTTSNITTTANVAAGTVLATNLSATSNVDGGNVNATTAVVTPSVVGSTVTITTTSNGNINLQPNGTGNIVLANTIINGLANPLQAQDAATKYYVDNMSTTGFAFHQAVFAATNTDLATATGGTITYTQPNGAGNGIGAKLTTTGTFYLIDTANIQTVGTRVLVKNEANAVFNGVYTYANTTTIVRSTDADEYGPDSSEQLSVNDYFFTQSGNVNAGTAFIVSAPAGVITFGTSNIEFSQFSSTQVYSANTQAGLSLTGTVFSAKVDNNTTAFDGSGNIIVKAGANLVTPNIGNATGQSLSVTGTITGGNLSAGSGYISTTGNVIGGNVTTGGVISATGNLTAGNITTGGIISAVGNIVSSANINASSAFVNAGAVLATGRVEAGTTMSAAGNITAANVITGGLITATGNITGGNLIATSNVYAVGLSLSGNVLSVINSTFNINTTGNITGGNIFQGLYQVLDTASTVDGGLY